MHGRMSVILNCYCCECRTSMLLPAHSCPCTCSACTQGLSCEEYQQLPEKLHSAAGAGVFALAQSKKWKRCPCCGHTVAKNKGCNHMTCLCKTSFCYGCGGKYQQGGCICRKKIDAQIPSELWSATDHHDQLDATSKVALPGQQR